MSEHSVSYDVFDSQVRVALYRMNVMRERLDKSTGAIPSYAFDVPGVSAARVELTERHYDEVEDGLARIKRLVENYAAELVLVGIPSRFMISDERIDNPRSIDKDSIRIDPMARAKAMAERNDTIYVDLKSRLVAARKEMLQGRREWNDLYVKNDFTHLNVEGHRIAADAIYVQLKKLDLLAVRSVGGR